MYMYIMYMYINTCIYTLYVHISVTYVHVHNYTCKDIPSPIFIKMFYL